MTSTGLRESSNNVFNGNERGKLAKRGQNENIEARKTEVLPAKRAALGTLSLNNSIRIQPFRAAKAHQAISHRQLSEGHVASSFNAPSQSFTIYVENGDDNDIDIGKSINKSTEAGHNKSLSSRTDSLSLNPVVTKLNRQPLTEVFPAPRIPAFSNDSPMHLDLSDDEENQAVNADHEPVKDIDSNCDEIIEVPEYAAEIHKFLKNAELKHRPKPGYMKKQPDINNSMRAILVDWLVEVSEEYRLSTDTLYLAVNYVDRFLSSMVVLRKKLQLVGTASMLIASKLEEVYPPEVSEFVYITDDTYTENEVRKMENLILKVLEFDLYVPTILSFLDRYEKAADVPEDSRRKFKFLTGYICELTLQDADPYLKYSPSTIATSAVVLALHILELPSWTSSLEYYSGYKHESLNDCISDLHRTFSMAPKNPQKAIREKYSESRFLNVASIPSPSSVPVA
ncbi:G2/mitotic-specific cyclin-A-like [Xenia sp. Carnegie-2017]|uniref:G2/mitotic-specific cyclin-A-like n=1 Tax=Xenia sp. Carnegie-2017 TaxID=2897299 RepID=UPI001F03FC8A|nr:G2/mitotic-specific cyclin-A-like [Xenia sp. Carnegie-2017]